MDTQNEFESEELVCSDCGEKISPTDTRCPNCGAEFENDINDLDEVVTQGRKLTVAIIGVSVAMLIVTGIIQLVSFDAGELLIYFIRLGLTALLLTLFYKGNNGARIILIVLFGIGGGLSLFLGFSAMNQSSLSILLILLGLLYISISVVIGIVKSIKVFQEYQREYYKMIKEN